MFDADPSLASRAASAKISVCDNIVSLDGTVPTRTDKSELQKRILTIPSVVEVNNHLDIAVPGR
jgi:osmotically-inducible protein OsmY